jgi:hypothetical protein
VMSRRDCIGVVTIHRCYMRKPGPRSEEPQTAPEWRMLIERCIQAGRENMLDAIRTIVQGRAGVEPTAVSPARQAMAVDRLSEFTRRARSRWAGLVSSLAPDDPARFPLGHYELGFEIFGDKTLPSLSDLRAAMKSAGSIKHTGWGPFVQLTRKEYEPKIVSDAIEAWLGLPAERVMGRPPAHCDFWRADPSGMLVLLRGYDEDSADNVKPGTCIDLTLPVWRVGEAILYVGRVAEFFGADPEIFVRCRFMGLKDRILASVSRTRLIFDDWRCADPEVSLERRITRAQARDNLVEVLHALLMPLYERFSFFGLSEKMVAEEVEKMTKNRF